MNAPPRIVLSLFWVKAVVAAANAAMVAIRAPHGQSSRSIVVVRTVKGPLDVPLLTLAWLGFFAPLIWVLTPWLEFADFPLRRGPLFAGIPCLAVGLWLMHRAHADLGTNWSIALEIRQGHRLITGGTYRHVRHPMYLAFLLFSLGQALIVPNWIAGPSYGVAFSLLVALRVGREERMMLETFGRDYEAYAARTKRLVPGVW